MYEKRVKSLITSTNTANVVMDYLKEQIIKGGYKPGEKINIDELSKEIQISKIPIREALMQLQPVGLVNYTANMEMRVSLPLTMMRQRRYWKYCLCSLAESIL